MTFPFPNPSEILDCVLLLSTSLPCVRFTNTLGLAFLFVPFLLFPFSPAPEAEKEDPTTKSETMSGWASYIAALTATEQVTQAIIFGHDGTVWAASPGLSSVLPPPPLPFRKLTALSGRER